MSSQKFSRILPLMEDFLEKLSSKEVIGPVSFLQDAFDDVGKSNYW